MQRDPNSVIAGGVDRISESKTKRREEKEANFQRLRAKEMERSQDESRVISWEEIEKDETILGGGGGSDETIGGGSGGGADRDEADGDDDANSGDDAEDEYLPPTHGHRRKRQKRITLNVDVESLRKSHSVISDRHKDSSRSRCDTLSNLVLQGGGDLYDVPCSRRTMIE